MTRGRLSDPLTLVRGIVLAITIVWCGTRAVRYAWHSMFMNFQAYDDEGYLLVSVHEFLAGRPLYDEVFSQYGPAYYAYKHALWLVTGLPTHDITRWTTLVIWLVSAGLLAWAALQLTRSAIAALAAFCAMVVALSALPNEPGHPQELTVGLISLAVALAASRINIDVRVALLFAIASVTALTKINIGAFMVLATLSAAMTYRSDMFRVGLSVALAMVPPVLMSRHLSEWAWPYAVVAGAGVLTAGLLAEESKVRWSSRAVVSILAALLVPPLLFSLYLLSRDSTLNAIIEGVLVRPVALTGIYVDPLVFRDYQSRSFIALSLAVTGLAMFHVIKRPKLAAWIWPAAPIIKLMVAGYIIVEVENPWPAIAGSALMAFALLIPGEAVHRNDSFGRTFLATSAAWHACTAYPVAGSQVYWSSFLIILGAYVCLWDGLHSIWRRVGTDSRGRAVAATALACGAWAVYLTDRTPLEAVRTDYASHVALNLPGARLTRAPPRQAVMLNWLVANLRGHCSAFVSLPGYNSLHLWSDLRPVTGYNATSWMSLLNDREQEQIIARMQQASDPCAVYDPNGVKVWNTRPVEDRPLVAYVLGLSPVARRRNVELRIPTGSGKSWTLEYILAGERTFDGTAPYLALPELISDGPQKTLRLWFRTVSSGTIVGLQSGLPPSPPERWWPIVYVGRDGRLRAGVWNGETRPIMTPDRVDDGQWHHVALVKLVERQFLYVDGVLIGDAVDTADTSAFTRLLIGDGFTASWPESNGTWFPFAGTVRDVAVAPISWTPADVIRDFSASLISR